MLLAKESLVQIDRQISLAAVHVQEDSKATAQLATAVEKLRSRSREVVTDLPAADDDQVVRAIVDLERLGDRARAAAEDDEAALEYTRRQVIDAHHWIHRLKHKTVGEPLE